MRWLACFVMVGLTACSGNVESNAAGGAAGTEGGGGSPGATSSTHGPGASSSAVATTSSGSTSASSTSGTGGAGAGGSSGVGGGVDCGGFVTMTVDNGGPEHLLRVCPDGHAEFETSEPAGYLLHGEGSGRTIVAGCAAPGGGVSEGISLTIVGDAMVGHFSDAQVTYTDATGAVWDQPIGFSADFTNVEDSGGVIEGTFKVQVSRGGNAAHLLDASFRVCHVQDVFLP